MMGNNVSITGLLANPFDRNRNCTVDFMVDTGANITLIPRPIAEKLKLETTGFVTAEIANGKMVRYEIAYVYLYLDGEGLMLHAAIADTSLALLGCDVIGLLQFQIDVARKKILKPVRLLRVVSMMLKFKGRRLSEILSGKR